MSIFHAAERALVLLEMLVETAEAAQGADEQRRVGDGAQRLEDHGGLLKSGFVACGPWALLLGLLPSATARAEGWVEALTELQAAPTDLRDTLADLQVEFDTDSDQFTARERC